MVLVSGLVAATIAAQVDEAGFDAGREADCRVVCRWMERGPAAWDRVDGDGAGGRDVVAGGDE